MWQGFGNRGGKWAGGGICAHRTQLFQSSTTPAAPTGSPYRLKGWAPGTELCQSCARRPAGCGKPTHNQTGKDGMLWKESKWSNRKGPCRSGRYGVLWTD